MSYNDQAKKIDFAGQAGATHATIEINEGEFKITLRETRETWDNLAPGEPFDIKAPHLEEPEQLLHFSGSDPTDAERDELETYYKAWREAPLTSTARDYAASDLIQSLMAYAGISEA